MNVSFYLRNSKPIPVSQVSLLSQVSEPGDNEINTVKRVKEFKSAIFARICYKGYKTKYYITEQINPSFWDKSAQRAKKIKKFPEYSEFNARLDNIESAIGKIALRYANDHGNVYPPPDTLKKLLDESGIRDGKRKEVFTFVSFFELFISHSKDGTRLTSKDKPITAGTIRTYETTKTCIENYQKHISKTIGFESIDISFYDSFKKYVTHTIGQSTNYIGKHIKIIKTVLQYAKKPIFGIKVNDDFRSREFKTLSEKTDSIYLAEYELKEIAGLDLSDDLPLDKVRDLFLIGCYTGLRFSDLTALRPENIENGMITITQIKTSQPVAIPVHEIVERIMTKYGGTLPKALSNQKMNDALKNIGKKCKLLKKKVSITYTKAGKTVTKAVEKGKAPEKWNYVTTHTARRSFATNQYLSGIPTLTIMAITDHRTETAFMKYIKVAAVEHANIIKTKWDNLKLEQPKSIAI